MYIISMERSGGGVAAGKRNQERSYHHCPHSQQRTSGVVTKEGSQPGRWWGSTLGLIHSFEYLRITTLPTLIHTQLRHHVQEGSQYVPGTPQSLL